MIKWAEIELTEDKNRLKVCLSDDTYLPKEYATLEAAEAAARRQGQKVFVRPLSRNIHVRLQELGQIALDYNPNA